MTDETPRHSALSPQAFESRAEELRGEAGVAISHAPFPGIIDLRGKQGDEAFMAAAEKALGVSLPATPNTTAATEAMVVLWLGPEEWWVVTPEPDEGLLETLRDGMSNVFAGVTAVGDSRERLKVSGPRARDLLSKGTPLDLHPSVFGGPGSVAQSRLAKAGIVLHQTAETEDDGPTFEIFVLRSFADYLWHWLEDAAREYGMTVVERP